MKVRIKFQKYGSMKFVGHLDVMRYFQKMLRRAEIDNEYTKGFSPHQIMSFAAPLGVGLTSDAEYVDIVLLSSDLPHIMIDRMNNAITEGFRVIGFHPLLEREENKKNVTAMSLVACADYLIALKDAYSLDNCLCSKQKFEAAFSEFINQSEIVINKKTKTSEKAVDIKPMIHFFAFDASDYRKKKNSMLSGSLPVADTLEKEAESVAPIYDNGLKVYLQADTGSSVNLKPELVMEAFFEYLGLPYKEFAWQVHRLELYTRLPEDHMLAQLDKVPR